MTIMAESAGKTLQQARIAKNLTLEQVAFQTKIRLRFLQALENDDHESLPSEVQARGFIRLYTGLLGMEATPILDLWDGKTPDPIVPVTPSPSTTEEVVNDDQATPLPSDDGTAQTAGQPPDDNESPDSEQVYQDPPSAHSEDLPVETGTSQQVMDDIGRQLKQRRIRLALTLGDVEEHLHIRQKYLEALEAGRLDDLPSPVQGRGLLNNYALFLDLPADRILLQFADVLQKRRVEMGGQPAGQEAITRRVQSASNHTLSQPLPASQIVNSQRVSPVSAGQSVNSQKAKQAPAWRRFVTPDLLVGSALIVILVGFAIWGAAQISSLRRQANSPDLPGLSEVMLTASIAPIPEEATPELMPTQIPAGQESADTGEEPVSDGNENPNPPETTIPGGTGPMNLYVVAKQRAWMRVFVDGREEFQGRITPGNAYTYSGSQQIELVCGNVDAIDVYYNQTQLLLGSGAGQVVNLQFNPAGIMTPTSAFTVTPTPTQPSTLAPTPTATVPSPTVTPYIP